MLPERWTPGSSPGVTIVLTKMSGVSVEPPRLFRQHDRDAVADWVGELGRARDQLLLLCVILERALGQRADQDFQKLRIDAASGTFGGVHGKALLRHARICCGHPRLGCRVKA